MSSFSYIFFLFFYLCANNCNVPLVATACLCISPAETSVQYIKKKNAKTVQYFGDCRYRSLKLCGQRRSHGLEPALCLRDRDRVLNCHPFRVQTEERMGFG
jgi:hypothetical protein